MALGLTQRERAKQGRRPAGREPRPTPDRAKKRDGERPSLLSIVGDTVHGVVFLGLAGAALLHFGQSFGVLAAVVAALSILSLREAWIGLRARQGKPPPGK
jgi:hypothetical protein